MPARISQADSSAVGETDYTAPMPKPSAELIAALLQLPPQGRAQMLNAAVSGFDAALGLKFEWVDPERVVITLEVTASHLQPYGLVHGGVYATLVESACSVGCALGVLPQGRTAVGASNSTRFLRGTRVGAVLRAEARPDPSAGTPKRQTWTVTSTDQTQETCATGTMDIAVLSPGTEIAGERVELAASDES